MKSIRYSPEAVDDLEEINEYFSIELENPNSAIKTVSMITKKIRELNNFPSIGMNLSAIIDIETDYHYLICGDYLAFYRFDEHNVYIIRVLNGKRDYLKLLFGDI